MAAIIKFDKFIVDDLKRLNVSNINETIRQLTVN